MHYRDISRRDFDALKTYARKLGAPLDDCDADLEAAEWHELVRLRAAVKRASYAALKDLEANNGQQREAELQGQHDRLMAIFDEVSDQIDLRNADPVHRRPVVAAECMGDGSPVRSSSNATQFRDRQGNPIRVYAPGERIEEGNAEGGFGVGDAVRAMFCGARNDVEKRALAEGTNTSGGYTVPSVLAGYFIDKLRNATVCFQAGALTVPMESNNLSIAKLSGDPTVAWTAENAQIAASDPTFGVVTLTPKKLLCYIVVSRELLEDSININDMLERAIVGAMSVDLDRALLFGSGSSNQPLGLANISGIGSVSMGTNGATPSTYDDLIDLVYTVQAANGRQPTGFILSPRTARTYAKLKDSQTNPLREPAFTSGITRFPTNAVPITQAQGTSGSVCSAVLAGDFSQMLVGMRRELEIIRSDQLLLQNDQVAFLARLRVDVAVTQPAHFAALIGIKP